MEQVLDYLAALGLEPERQNTGVGVYANRDGTERQVRYGNKGDLDIRLTLKDGRTCEIEAKAEPRGKVARGKAETPTPEQWERIRKLNAKGGVAFWTNDVGHVMRIMPHVLDGARVEETQGEEGPEVICRPGCRACGGSGSTRSGRTSSGRA